MTDRASISNSQDPARPVTSRATLARLMQRVCADIGASRHMVVEPMVERGPKSVRIITSNWVFDALEDLGVEGIVRIIESGHVAGAGMQPRAMRPSTASFLAEDERQTLAEHGHAEMFCQRLSTSRGSVFALFSAAAPRRIDTAALLRAHMTCCYALNQYFAASSERGASAPLSERERECLLWVSEGKTTDEVALILGVSSHTVNSYVAHAIQKFGASNRAMAIATAIRSGII